ncbi:MAG: GDSL family lipase, partial [Chloroflexota bacterium]|nr:GDSL family lipase [Chloroflexota bacterium]
SIMIGINDVWRHFGGFQIAGQVITLEEYMQTLDELIGQIHPELSGMILMTPYYLETKQNEPIRSMMDQFGSAVHDLARKYDALLADTQAAFDQVLQSLHPYQLAMDRVHVNLTGHSVLARAWLRCVGYQFVRPESWVDKTAGG